MIDEKKLIENLEKEWEELVDYSEGVDVLLEYVTRFINEQPKIGEWIPCSDPPKHNKEVLIYNGKSYSVGYYDGKKWINTIHPVEWQDIHHE